MAWFESLPQILHDISKEINKIKYKLSNDILNVLRKLWSQIQLVLKNKKISNMSYDDENMTKNNINTMIYYLNLSYNNLQKFSIKKEIDLNFSRDNEKFINNYYLSM